MIKKITLILLLIGAKNSFSQGEHKRFGIGLNAGLGWSLCDGSDIGTPGFSGGLTAKYSISNRFGLRAGLHYTRFENVNSSYSSTSSPLAFDIQGIFNAINFRRAKAEKNGYRPVFSTLYIGIGGGIFNATVDGYSKNLVDPVTSVTSSFIATSLGYKIKLNETIDLNFEYSVRTTSTDLLDGFNPQLFSNRSNDYYGISMIGITFNIGGGSENIEWTDGFEGLVKNIKVDKETSKTASKKDYDALKKRVDELESMVKDSDKDGVPDIRDNEINSPTIMVDKNGVTLDTDGDKIPDYLDKCPQVKGSNADGCNTAAVKPDVKYVAGAKIDLGASGIQYGTGNAIIKPISYSVLNKVVKIMNDNLELELRVEGHTDNLGNNEANLALSKARALAVKKYLIENGIEDYRIMAEGFGSKKPIANNKTPKGRSQNRRVDFILQ